MNFLRGDDMNELEAIFGNPGEEPPSLTPEQQTIRLVEVAKLAEQSERFEPGDILEHKWPELATSKSSTSVTRFSHYLAEPLRASDFITEPGDLFNNSVTEVFDCVYSVILSGNHHCTFFGDSSEWRKNEKLTALARSLP